MRYQKPALSGFLPAVGVVLLLVCGLVFWQPSAVTAQIKQPGGSAPRMPWGDPDLQGVWSSRTLTPLQRPDKYAGREFLTDQEVVELEKANVEDRGRDKRAERGSVADVEGAYNNAFSSFWGNKVVRTKRTSLI